MEQVTSAAHSIKAGIPDHLLPLFKFLVSALNIEKRWEFNPFVTFTLLFLATIPNELPLLSTINHRICQKPGAI